MNANCVDTIRIEDIYQEILDGKRRNFPQYTWSEDVDRDLAKRITRYLLEVVLNWNTEQIINGWTRDLIVKYKLSGMLGIVYNGNLNQPLHDAYPDRFKEWQLRVAPVGYWTAENSLEALKWTIEVKLKLSDEELMEVYSFEWVKQIGLRTPLVHFWSKNAYKMLNTLYPGRYKREMLISLKPMK
ncbi:DUF4046 domain-containing protein [Bacillus cereus]|nr:DUF4046 domain-containing protein [Bacillus cereus]